jgi:hypothetical protein
MGGIELLNRFHSTMIACSTRRSTKCSPTEMPSYITVVPRC